MQCRTRFQLASNWPRKLAQVTRPINAIITASKPNRSECDRSPITTSYVSQFLMANQFWVYATHPQLMSVNEKTRWTSGSRRRRHDANDTRTLASVILQTSCVRTQVARGAAEFWLVWVRVDVLLEFCEWSTSKKNYQAQNKPTLLENTIHQSDRWPVECKTSGWQCGCSRAATPTWIERWNSNTVPIAER